MLCASGSDVKRDQTFETETEIVILAFKLTQTKDLASG